MKNLSSLLTIAAQFLGIILIVVKLFKSLKGRKSSRPLYPSSIPFAIFNRNGKKVGIIKQDTIQPCRYIIYNEQGNRIGIIKPDALRHGRWTIDRLE